MKRRMPKGKKDRGAKPSPKSSGAVTKILVGILLIAGLGILLYPVLCNALNQYKNDQMIRLYAKGTEALSTEERQAIWGKATAYNRAHTCNRLTDVFGEGGSETKGEYLDLLNPVGNGMMGYLAIPKIDVELVIYHGTGEDVLSTGCGHLAGTSLPVGGEGTHCVLAGHRGLPTAELFTDIDQLEMGDLFFLHILDKTLVYSIDQIKVVTPEHLEDLKICKGKDHVTLVTCTPYGVNSHRMLVRGHRTTYNGSEEEGCRFSPSFLMLLVLLLTVLAEAVVVWRLRRKKQPKHFH